MRRCSATSPSMRSGVLRQRRSRDLEGAQVRARRVDQHAVGPLPKDGWAASPTTTCTLRAPSARCLRAVLGAARVGLHGHDLASSVISAARWVSLPLGRRTQVQHTLAGLPGRARARQASMRATGASAPLLRGRSGAGRAGLEDDPLGDRPPRRPTSTASSAPRAAGEHVRARCARAARCRRHQGAAASGPRSSTTSRRSSRGASAGGPPRWA